MTRLQEHYNTVVHKSLSEEFGYKNPLAVPRLDKLEQGPVATFCKVFFVGIWPGLALLVGFGVFLVRRR